MNCKYPSNQVKSSSLLKLLVLFFIKYVADDCIVSNTLLIYALQRLGETKKTLVLGNLKAVDSSLIIMG